MDVLTGYEAGCLGYLLYWQLTEKGVACNILAPTTMKRSVKNVTVKNDRMDANNIAPNLVHGTYKVVYVPNNHDIEVKEYIRLLHNFKEDSKKGKATYKRILIALRLSLSWKIQMDSIPY